MALPRKLHRSKTQTKPATRGYRTRTDTINLLYTKMYALSSPTGNTDRDMGWRTANEIAVEVLGRKGKYPALWDILNHLVTIGWLEEKWGVAANGRDARLFRAIKYTADGQRLY